MQAATSRPPRIEQMDVAQQQPLEELLVFDERGLVPCVVQDWASGEVLTLAYMNAEAFARTRATGELHLYSRSREALWHKGETSGNVQAVKALRVDCDGDALLALVEPAGPACHTGERTCFHRGELGSAGALRGTTRSSSARLPTARASGLRAPTRWSCSTTRRGLARR